MLVRAICPDLVTKASFLFGDETPSYQNNTSKFKKLFTVFHDQTMTGLIINFSTSPSAVLLEVEQYLLQLFNSAHQWKDKRPVPNLINECEKITFSESLSYTRSHPPQMCIKLLKIVGIWETQEEFGLVYKFIRSQMLPIPQSAEHSLD